MNKQALKVVILGLLVCIIFFLAPKVFAGGKLITQANYGIETKSTTLNSIGVQMNESLMGPLSYNAYVGYGTNQYTDREDLHWTVMKQGVDLKLSSKLMVGTGVGIGFVFPDNNFNDYVYLKAAYDLW